MDEHPFGEGRPQGWATELQCPFAPCPPEAAEMNLRLRLSHGGRC